MLVPAQSASNLRRLAALGLEGDYGFFDAVDYTDRGQGAGAGLADTANPVIVRTYMAHHQGMTLVALANALLGDRMVARFHTGLPRAGDRAAAAGTAAARRARAAAPARRRRAGDGAAAAAGAPVSHAAHGLPARAVPVERPARLRRDERRRRQPAARRRGGDPVAPRRHARSRQRRTSTCATSGAATSGRRPTIRRRSSRTTTSRRSVPIARRFAAATGRSSASSTSPSRPRTTSRCGGSRSPIRARARARST